METKNNGVNSHNRKTTEQDMRRQNNFTMGHNDVSDGNCVKATYNGADERCEVGECLGEQRRPTIWPQVLGAVVAALAQSGSGASLGYSGVMLPSMTDNASHDLVLDQHQAALFSSTLNLGSAVGCLAVSAPMILLGQRMTMLLLLPIFCASWVALGYSSYIWMLHVSRVVMGVTRGAIEVAAYGYVTEIAHSSVRGALVGLLDTVRIMGLLLVYILGSFTLNWRQVALLSGCLTTIPSFVALVFLPDASRWLVTKGRNEKARQSMSFFRGLRFDITTEMDAISSKVKDDFKEGYGLMITQLQQIKEPTTLKIVITLAFLMFSAQFTGNIVVLSYVVPIFNAAEVDINSYMSAVVVALVRLVSTVVSLSVIDYIGRRPAIITSFLLIGTSLLLFGVFFLMQSLDFDLTSFSWFPLILLTCFSFVTSVGHSVLYLVRGELLSTPVRSSIVPYLYSLLFVGMFVASHTYPALTASVGLHWAFWVYASVSYLVALVTAFFIPETRGVPLENISLTMPFQDAHRGTYTVSVVRSEQTTREKDRLQKYLKKKEFSKNDTQ